MDAQLESLKENVARKKGRKNHLQFQEYMTKQEDLPGY